jgi:hypothetical protein
MGSADLTRADLSNADLTGAILVGAKLNGATLREADLTGVSLSIAHLKRADLTYTSYLDALVQLRKEFQEAGLREQERKITHALKRREAELSWEGCKSRELPEIDVYTQKHKTRAILWSPDSNLANCGAFVLNRVFFDWTCQYGMSPGRPLSLGLLVWVLCSILYFACIHTSGEAGLYRIYAPGIRDNPSETRRVERISPSGEIHARGWRRIFQFLRQEWLVLRASMFFSLMSAFNIGFRDINFGRWLRLLTRQEFDIKAVGWARVVAGWQSLLSVYFIALWVLTYFGRPFG